MTWKRNVRWVAQLAVLTNLYADTTASHTTTFECHTAKLDVAFVELDGHWCRHFACKEAEDDVFFSRNSKFGRDSLLIWVQHSSIFKFDSDVNLMNGRFEHECSC